MSQLIIRHNSKNEWRMLYSINRSSKYKCLSVPIDLIGKDRIIGKVIDNRIKWREKLDSITQNAEYDIMLKTKVNV